MSENDSTEADAGEERANTAPMDVLEQFRDSDPVTVRLKSGEIYRGTLTGYDQHMNLVLTDVESPPGSAATTDAPEPVADQLVIRGDNVLEVWQSVG
jgi:small nuclear ribonucleoprotein